MKTTIISVRGLGRHNKPITREFTAKTALDAVMQANRNGIRKVQSIRIKG